MKMIVEPTGALGAAGLFERGLPVTGKRVGVILSGGNADFKLIAKYF
jgi:threonine dehydratase